MLYLVSYDIPSTLGGDRRRARLARYLESLGLRVQWSFFELEIDPGKLKLILSEISDCLNPAEDSVRVYTCCATCAKQVHHLGQRAAVEHDALLVW
jgi:CRISPR-associated endonuclease Cas2